MTFSVVEDGTVVNNASGTSFTLPLATAPQQDDIVFVLIDCNNTNSISAVSGLGATWTVPTPYSSTSITYLFAIGTGATSSGNVSVTTGTSRGGSGNVMLLRGGGANPVLTAGTPATGFTGTGTVLTGPSQSVPANAFVIARYGFQATGRTYSFPDTQTPAASFTAHGAISNSSTFDRAWATPSSAGTYQVTAKITGGSGGASAVLGQWYLTTAPPSATSGAYKPASVTASSINSASFDAPYAADGIADVNHRWAALSSNLPQWLQYDLGTPKVVDYYSIAPGGFDATQNPTAWTLYGSFSAPVADTFNRGDSPSSLGSTSVGALPWVAVNGTWGTISSTAYVSNGVTDQVCRALVDNVSPNGTVSAAVTGGTGGSYMGLIVRSDGAGNEFLIEVLVNGATYTPKIYKVVAGTGTVIATGTAVSVANGSVLSVEFQGSSIVVKDDGVAIVSATDSSYAAQTRHGLYIACPTGSSAAARIDNFNLDGWETLDSVSAQTFSAPTPKLYAFTNAKAFRHYRLNITANGGGVTSISELALGKAEAATTVRESATGNIDGTTSGTVSLATTPNVGDAVIVSIVSSATDVVPSGLGATWTELYDGMASSWNGSHSIWRGVGATTSGTITLTAGAAFQGQALALLLDGGDGVMVQSAGNAANLTGVGNGQIAISAVYANSDATPVLDAATTVPTSTSWSTSTRFDSTAGFRMRQAWRLVSASESYSGRWTSLGSGAGANQVLLGMPALEAVSGQAGAVAMSASSSLTAGAAQTLAAAVSMAASSTLAATADAPVVSGAVSMSSTSTLSTSGDTAKPGAVAMSSTSTLSAIGTATPPPAYQAAVMADSPGANWRLDDTDGSVNAFLADASGNARRLRVYAASTTVSQTGLISDGTSVRVGVNTSYIQTENSNSWSQVTSGDFTAECWVKILDTAPVANCAILDRANMNWGNDQWSIWWDPANGLRAFMGASAAGHVVTWAKASSEAAVQAGGHLVVTREGATATVRIYWNGTEVASGTGAASPVAVSRVVGIGSDMSGTSRISAYIDEVALYPGTRLTPTRIQAHYEAGAGMQGAVAMSSASTLTADAVTTGVAAVAMSSSSTLTAGASGGGASGAVDMQATSTLVVTSGADLAGAVDMQSTSTLTASGRTKYVEQYRIPLGMASLVFARGSVLLPYAGAETGSQALDFSIATEAPVGGLYVPVDGPADSRSVWIAITSSASQTLTVTPSTSFAVGLEVWDGDPATDPTGLSLVASGTGATLDVPVAAGQQLLIRVHPMTNAASGTGSVSWAVAARPDSGILQFYAATTIFETPGWLPANVAAATPGGTLEFTLDGGSTVIFTAIADDQGLWPESRVLLPELAVGTHSITVTDVGTGQTATRTFDVAIVPPAPTGGVVAPPPSPPAYVQRWYFEDAGGEHYAFPINPSGMTSPHPARSIVADHTLSPTGRAILWEGINDPTLWTVTGACETQAFYEALERFYAMPRRIYVTDHLSRIWTVSFEALDLVEQKSAENPWAYTYTAKFNILDGPVIAP